MKRIPEIIGRKKEQEKLQRIVESKKSEFLALYGRRRVGKTFLIKEYFSQKFAFHMSRTCKCRYTSAAFQF
jgi:hypothetical protein